MTTAAEYRIRYPLLQYGTKLEEWTLYSAVVITHHLRAMSELEIENYRDDDDWYVSQCDLIHNRMITLFD